MTAAIVVVAVTLSSAASTTVLHSGRDHSPRQGARLIESTEKSNTNAMEAQELITAWRSWVVTESLLRVCNSIRMGPTRMTERHENGMKKKGSNIDGPWR